MFSEQLKSAVISINGATDNTIITCPAGAQIVIDHINLVPNGAVSVTLKSASTALSGTYALTTSQGFVLENSTGNQEGVITCNKDEDFVITLGSAVQVSGFVRYRLRLL